MSASISLNGSNVNARNEDLYSAQVFTIKKQDNNTVTPLNLVSIKNTNVNYANELTNRNIRNVRITYTTNKNIFNWKELSNFDCEVEMYEQNGKCTPRLTTIGSVSTEIFRQKSLTYESTKNYIDNLVADTEEKEILVSTSNPQISSDITIENKNLATYQTNFNSNLNSGVNDYSNNNLELLKDYSLNSNSNSGNLRGSASLQDVNVNLNTNVNNFGMNSQNYTLNAYNTTLGGSVNQPNYTLNTNATSLGGIVNLPNYTLNTNTTSLGGAVNLPNYTLNTNTTTLRESVNPPNYTSNTNISSLGGAVNSPNYTLNSNTNFVNSDVNLQNYTLNSNTNVIKLEENLPNYTLNSNSNTNTLGGLLNLQNYTLNSNSNTSTGGSVNIQNYTLNSNTSLNKIEVSPNYSSSSNTNVFNLGGSANLQNYTLNSNKNDIQMSNDSFKLNYSYPEGFNFEEFSNNFLKGQNEKRSLHGVGSLSLNPRISELAQSHAQKLAEANMYSSSKNTFNNEKLGESIFIQAGAAPRAEYVINSWYNQSKNYNFDDHQKPNGLVDHFTQLVWKNSKEVGVGCAVTSTGKYYVVVNYYPSGNIRGTEAENVFRC